MWFVLTFVATQIAAFAIAAWAAKHTDSAMIQMLAWPFLALLATIGTVWAYA